MQEIKNRPHSFEHLLRLNRMNNHFFFLGGFGHSCNNTINSIHLGSTLLNNYIQDINALFDNLDDGHDRLPAGFYNECSTVLTAMPQVIKGIGDSARRLKQLVANLTEYTGESHINAAATVDINMLVSHSSSMNQQQISNYTNHFRLDLEDSLTVLPGSSGQIAQVILNLLMNALISLPDRSCGVTISTSSNHETGQAIVSIRDEGIGIQTDLFPHIVEPFFTTWQEHGCAGLGLTVADQIIRNHGGKLSLYSEPDRGTTARFSLPIKLNNHPGV